MDFIPTSIEGCFIIQPKILRDTRGSFIKTFHENIFFDQGLENSFSEDYYSVSKKGVLRGLHFQIPPFEHAKLIYCLEGCIFDAVLDLRKNSTTFGKYATIELNAKEANILYVPIGLAHGFYVLSEKAIVTYKVSTVYSKKHDEGILWNSAGIPWPEKNPNISKRDSKFIKFAQFQSPFK